jgi:hypothetical protein
MFACSDDVAHSSALRPGARPEIGHFLGFNSIPVRELRMADEQHTTNWPDLAIGLYDRLTGRNAKMFSPLLRSLRPGTDS